MPAYHSTFLTERDVRTVGNFAVLPLRTRFRGPGYTTNDYDIADEVLDLFRANSFFRNFEIKGPADRALIYGILFISDCISNIKPNMNSNEALKVLNNIALDHFSIPGEPNFPLNTMYAPPRDRNDAEFLRGYLQQFRQELVLRLVSRIYQNDSPYPSKHWLAFTRRRFMNKSLS